jgi:formylglycine-generating enzyme required for sulfatase activity
VSRRLVVAFSVLLVIAASLSFAQDAKPWEKPGAKVGDEIIGPDGGEMVWVPAGQFLMGSLEGQGDKHEHPAHPVRITKGFWLGKCTVTNAQYRQYCQETGVEFPKDSDKGDNRPIACVGWDDAAAYCQHYGLHLPTEAQWEYAARGPECRTYPWGNEWDPRKCCNGANKGPDGSTFAVGSFLEGASWCGALDMAGNVCQWCNDWYSEAYYANSPDADPPGPGAGDSLPDDVGQCRVLRGGSWGRDDPGYFRCAVRYYADPSYRVFRLGFRCVRGL